MGGNGVSAWDTIEGVMVEAGVGIVCKGIVNDKEQLFSSSLVASREVDGKAGWRRS
jgi:hypothetical protein